MKSLLTAILALALIPFASFATDVTTSEEHTKEIHKKEHHEKKHGHEDAHKHNKKETSAEAHAK